MASLPPKIRNQILADPYYKRCCRADEGGCGNIFGRLGQIRVTWEHAILYAGKKVQEKWAVIPLCWRHHLGDRLQKDFNIKTAMARATEEERKEYPRLNWAKLRL